MPNWRTLFEAAKTESDPNAFAELVYQTEAAILQRLRELEHQNDASGELLELKQASAVVLQLKVQKLGWPDPYTQSNKVPS